MADVMADAIRDSAARDLTAAETEIVTAAEMADVTADRIADSVDRVRDVSLTVTVISAARTTTREM